MAAEIMYVTVAGAGLKDGSSWDNAFGLAEWLTDATTLAEDGDIYYVEEGTYTLTGNFDADSRDATQPAIIQVIGVKSGTTAEPPTLADYAAGATRPVIAATSWQFRFGNGWHFKNIAVTTTEANGFKVAYRGLFENCKSTNSSGTANRDAFRSSADSRYINCEGISTNGDAFDFNGSGQTLIGCYAHDSKVGVNILTDDDVAVINCIIDTCITGIQKGDAVSAVIMNCTIYNCTTGIDSTATGTAHFSNLFLNNIIDTCTTGANWAEDSPTDFWDYNNWNNNDTDVVNVTKGLNATAYDPKFVDAANGNFSLYDNSQCIGAGAGISLGVG